MSGLIPSVIGPAVPAAEVAEAPDEVLTAIARTGPAARAAVKRDLNQRLPQQDVGLFFRSIRSPEMVEGMASFIEKREPDWPR